MSVNVDVKILDKVYVLSCQESQREELASVVEAFIRKISEINSLSGDRTDDQVLVVAAVNLLYDFLQQRRVIQKRVQKLVCEVLKPRGGRDQKFGVCS